MRSVPTKITTPSNCFIIIILIFIKSQKSYQNFII